MPRLGRNSLTLTILLLGIVSYDYLQGDASSLLLLQDVAYKSVSSSLLRPLTLNLRLPYPWPANNQQAFAVV